ncbi:hypothetical protein [Allopontixanthobacter sp.]|uniref:hypothetical protein n=1 Tax=Allopontixanthobacter sp. TaxID=2906452 RepID=UPI002ABC7C23|nr:hypothetical protein [Allopontixanthobacter sp.]MDZ4306982.1 hypothetical protein [Allopontixanthobacter sp.]
MQPYEIIGAPLTVWIAPVGEAFPLINVAPAGNWVKLGTNGDRNYSNDGVTVSHSKTYQKARPAGATGPIKAFLDEEDLMIRLVLWDITLEQYAYALNSNTVTTTAAGSGTAGFKKIGLSQSVGRTAEFALIARGLSPYDEAMAAQYEVPRCYDSGSAEPVYRKGQPAGLALELTALEDLEAASEDERFGRFVAQHQIPLA